MTDRPLARGSAAWKRYAVCALTLLGLPAVLHGAQLKWKPVRPVTQVQLEQSAKPRTTLDAYPVKPAAAMQNEDNSSPLADPFEDGRREIESNVDDVLDGLDLKSEAPRKQPEEVETRRAPTDPGLDSAEDHFPNLRAPVEENPADPLSPDSKAAPPADAPGSDDALRNSPYYEAPGRRDQTADCGDAKADCNDALARLKANTLVNIDLDIQVAGVEGQDFPCECDFGVGEVFQGRQWNTVTYNWKASGLCHKPLYFEQVALERYGHSAPTFVQAAISGAHFFASVVSLPYMMGLCPPDECQYSLGYYRPGNCAPYLIDPIPLSLRAGLFQAGAIVGGILIIP